jgi:hypothetical protein
MAVRKPIKPAQPKKSARNRIDFDEIEDGLQFEDLVASYFNIIKEEKNIKDVVRVKQSGEGTDGGCDILVTFRITDSIVSFERTWVVQCKFKEKAISNRELSTINIPTLIHSYKANGYLLVCKNRTTSGVTQLFDRFGGECKLGYAYMIWTGNELKERLRLHRPLIAQYFPEHSEFLQSQKGG